MVYVCVSVCVCQGGDKKHCWRGEVYRGEARAPTESDVLICVNTLKARGMSGWRGERREKERVSLLNYCHGAMTAPDSAVSAPRPPPPYTHACLPVCLPACRSWKRLFAVLRRTPMCQGKTGAKTQSITVTEECGEGKAN